MEIPAITNNSYAALGLLLDCSGSMYSIKPDVIGSTKHFIEEQKTKSGEANLQVAQFNHNYRVICNDDLKNVNADEVVGKYSTSGSTALLDAIGRMTLDMEKTINETPIEKRPTRVVVAVITDGMENASTEFNIEKIREMITAKEAQGWDFMFLGASLDAISVAKNMGFAESKASYYNTSSFDTCMSKISEKFSAARINQEVKFTQEERDDLMNASKTTSASA